MQHGGVGGRTGRGVDIDTSVGSSGAIRGQSVETLARECDLARNRLAALAGRCCEPQVGSSGREPLAQCLPSANGMALALWKDRGAL